MCWLSKSAEMKPGWSGYKLKIKNTHKVTTAPLRCPVLKSTHICSVFMSCPDILHIPVTEQRKKIPRRLIEARESM